MHSIWEGEEERRAREESNERGREKTKDKSKGQVVNINSHYFELYLPLSWLFYSLTKYLLSKYYVPGTVLDPGDAKSRKTCLFLSSRKAQSVGGNRRE